MPHQPVIDGFEFAASGRVLKGELPVLDFPRLHDLLLQAVEAHGWLPFRRPADPATASHIVSLGRPGTESAGVLTQLGTAGIVCSLRGDRLRVSLSPYNDEDDIAALATALA